MKGEKDLKNAARSLDPVAAFSLLGIAWVMLLLLYLSGQILANALSTSGADMALPMPTQLLLAARNGLFVVGFVLTVGAVIIVSWNRSLWVARLYMVLTCILIAFLQAWGCWATVPMLSQLIGNQ